MASYNAAAHRGKNQVSAVFLQMEKKTQTLDW